MTRRGWALFAIMCVVWGIPYLLINGRLDNTAASVRMLGKILGVTERAEAIARYVEDTEKLIDERLKDVPPAARKRVYLARQPNGLETGLQGSINTEIIERAGGINVAERAAGRGGIANVSIEQVIAWAPDTIITWDADSGQFLHAYGGHSGSIRALAYSPDGRRLASGSDDKTVGVWSAN